VLFVLLGFCRGILRVTSAATVAELRSEGKDVGIASGVYNAGLDIGAIIGPAIGGVLGNAFGLPAMFQIVAVASLALYFGVALSTDAGRASLAIRRPSLVWLRGRDQS
jgi:predicted MFS family arabinose efflux permease